MTKVFISHSQYDTELASNISKALRNIGSDAVLMEYVPKKEAVPDWERIKTAVYESEFVLLFKTDNAIRTDYTKSWIIYEVGISAAYNKPLCVFERKGPDIVFPIPYLTDYKIIDPTNVSDVLTVQEIAKKIQEERKKVDKKESSTSSGTPWSGLIFMIAMYAIGTYLSGPINIICPNCGSKYRYHEGMQFTPFSCPVCLKRITPESQAEMRAAIYDEKIDRTKTL